MAVLPPYTPERDERSEENSSEADSFAKPDRGVQFQFNISEYLGKPSRKKNGETWEKVQTSFTPSLPPSTWELLTVIFYCIFGL